MFYATKMVTTKLWQHTSQMTDITVLIASQSPAIRAKLEDQLSSSGMIRLVGSAEANEDIRGMIAKCQPDVLVIHTPTCGEPREEFLLRLAGVHPGLKILALECSPEHVRSCFIKLTRWGLRGCICHWKGATELIDAIRTIGNGEFYLCPIASHALVDAYRHMIHHLVREEA